MNIAGNTNWLTNRPSTQRMTARALPEISVRDISQDIVPATVRGLRLIPSWIILGMILLATLGICATVIFRTRAESRASQLQHQQMLDEIAATRRANESLQIEIRRMTTDPNIIESAARIRLGMVRPNDVVIPVEPAKQGTAFGTLSFVR
ncbi:MAG: septum formation initiator family protein [Acidobacteriota bacterium]